MEIDQLQLEEQEVEEVIWMDYAECRQGVQEGSFANCIFLDELELVGHYLKMI